MVTDAKFLKVINYLQKHFKSEFYFYGSISDCFHLGYDISHVGDIDVLINTDLEYLKKLPELFDLEYRGDSSHIGEEEKIQQIYQVKLKIDDDIINLDITLGKSKRLVYEYDEVDFKNNKIKISSVKFRMAILNIILKKMLWKNRVDLPDWLEKKKVKYDLYKKKFDSKYI